MLSHTCLTCFIILYKVNSLERHNLKGRLSCSQPPTYNFTHTPMYHRAVSNPKGTGTSGRKGRGRSLRFQSLIGSFFFFLSLTGLVETGRQILGMESSYISSLENKEYRNRISPLPGLPVCTTSMWLSIDILGNVKRIWYKVLASFICTCAEALVNVSLKCSTCFFYLKLA